MCIVQGQGHLCCDVRVMRMQLLLVGRDESFWSIWLKVFLGILVGDYIGRGQ